jgi:L-threonylcarbamoyladenylate synthase
MKTESTMQQQLDLAVKHIHAGGIILYPTEAVYGLGCDPFNQTAVMRLLALKQRAITQGLIVIAANWQQVEHLCQPLEPQQLQAAWQSWPGHETWLFPARQETPNWLTGRFNSIALRVTAHPITAQLCLLANMPLVSTSANINGQPAVNRLADVCHALRTAVDFAIDAEVGNAAKPSRIRDIISQQIIRE